MKIHFVRFSLGAILNLQNKVIPSHAAVCHGLTLSWPAEHICPTGHERDKILHFTHRLYLYDTWNYQNKRTLFMPKKLQVRFM